MSGIARGLASLTLIFASPLYAQEVEDKPAEQVDPDAGTTDSLTEELFADENDDETSGKATFEAVMAAMLTVPELTDKQKARLPTARRVVDILMPDGAYAEMLQSTMDEVFSGMLGELAQESMSISELSEILGVQTENLVDVSFEDRKRLTLLVDPAYPERARRLLAAAADSVSDIFVEMEPALREGYIRAYASRFTKEQLDDIAVFFATDTGKKFAVESLEIQADPHVLHASFEGMSEIEGNFSKIVEDIAAADEDLPEERTFDSLTQSERQEIADLLSISVLKLEMDMRMAQEKRETEEQAVAVSAGEEELTDQYGEALSGT